MLCLGFISFAVLSVAAAQTYTADPLSISKCPVIKGNEIDYDINLVEEGGEKSLKMSAKLAEELNDDYTFKANVEMLNNGHYIHYMEFDGAVCESLDKVMKPAFNRLKSEMQPPVKGGCTIPSGDYVLTGYKMSKDELDVPIPADGQFRTIAHMYNKDGVEVACLQGEVIIRGDEE